MKEEDKMQKRIDLPRGNYIEIEVEQDTNAQDPRVDSCMAAFHIADTRLQFESILEKIGITKAEAIAMANGGVVDIDGKLYMGLERYSHGQDVYALCQQGDFPDRRRDVSPLVGFITPDEGVDSDVIAEYHRLDGSTEAKEALSKRLNQDIDTFNQWLSGEVYGCTATLYDKDGTELDDDSFRGFYGEDYCMTEGMSTAYSLALMVLTTGELAECLIGDDKLSGYVKEWAISIPVQVGQAEEQAMFDYITKLYLKDAIPELLIARMKSDVHDDYPEHPQEDWRMEAVNGDTILGYWEWVNHRIVECQDDNKS